MAHTCNSCVRKHPIYYSGHREHKERYIENRLFFSVFSVPAVVENTFCEGIRLPKRSNIIGIATMCKEHGVVVHSISPDLRRRCSRT